MASSAADRWIVVDLCGSPASSPAKWLELATELGGKVISSHHNSAAAKNGALTYASESSKAAGRAHEGATQEWFEDGTGTVFMEQGRLDAGGEVGSLTVFVAKLVGGKRAK